jgi:hypothetical protein
MATPYDKTLRHDLVEAFGRAANDLAPCGAREVVDAAVDFLIITMIQHLGSLSPNISEEVFNPFVKRARRAVETAVAQHTREEGRTQ